MKLLMLPFKPSHLLLFLLPLAFVSCVTRQNAKLQFTPHDVVSLVNKAKTTLETQGPSALSKLSNDPAFKKGNLYVFVADSDGLFLAHGLTPSRLGKNIKTLVDSDGNPYGQKLFKAATREGKWIPYLSTKPSANPAQPALQKWKFTYIQRTYDGYIVGAGIYLD